MSVPADQLTRTGIKAAIRRGEQAAQAQMHRMDAEVQAELVALYAQARASIEQRINDAGLESGVVRLAMLQGLLRDVDRILDTLAQSQDDLLATHLHRAAEIGEAAVLGSPQVAVAAQASPGTVVSDAVRTVRTFIAEDGLQLSDRIWRVNQGARERIGRAITSAVVQGQSAVEAAQQFLARGEPVPADVQTKMNAAQAQRLARTAGRALAVDEGNAMAHALRVFRTEINRAHGTAWQTAALSVDGVVGTRFVLSPDHPRVDICDLHARVNLYGLGPGVYPPGKSPWPAHPNTLSFEVAVFADEVTAEDQAGRQSVLEYLNARSPGDQALILNSRKKAAALRRGLLPANAIATPWRDFKPRLQRRGIDTDSL